MNGLSQRGTDITGGFEGRSSPLGQAGDVADSRRVEDGTPQVVHDVAVGEVHLARGLSGQALFGSGRFERQSETRSGEGEVPVGCLYLKLAPAETPEHPITVASALKKEAVEMAGLTPALLLAEETGLYYVGSAIFGTEDVAVAAVVAEVEEVADLMASFE
jgi:hypothetical protein